MRREDWYVLSSAVEIHPKKLWQLLNTLGAEEDLFALSDQVLLETGGFTPNELGMFLEAKRKAPRLIEQYYNREENGIHMVLFSDSDYPARLHILPDAPLFLFVKGELPRDDEKTVGMVGARACTDYGRKQTSWMAQELAQNGCLIVSGMAAGIDRASHEGAMLAPSGRTFAVLGCGVDICYPPGNRKLYEQIPFRGGVISEFHPGTQPIARFFPRRNRIISALSDVVAVMEARKKSGSLITAGYALEQGKEVLALPGRIDDPLSSGCLQLIRDGAGLLMETRDIMDALCTCIRPETVAAACQAGTSIKLETEPAAYQAGTFINPEEGHQERQKSTNDNALSGRRRSRARAGAEKIVLAEPENTVYHSIDLTPGHLDQILERCRLPYPQVCAALISLEVQGLIEQVSGNSYRKRQE